MPTLVLLKKLKANFVANLYVPNAAVPAPTSEGVFLTPYSLAFSDTN